MLPGIPVKDFLGEMERQVEIRREDGRVFHCHAAFAIPRSSKMDPNNLYFLCLVKGIAKDEIPAGSELWVNEPG